MNLMADHDSVTPPPLSISRRKTKPYSTTGTAIAVVPASLLDQPIPGNKMGTFPEHYFKLIKELEECDLHGNGGLSLLSESAEKYILSSMTPADAQLCRNGTGKEFPVFDMNDESVQSLSLFLKKWKKSGFALTGNWVPDFVIRKHLEKGDRVGIAFSNGCLLFKLLKKTAN